MENSVSGEYTTDYAKELFRITITACEGGIKLDVANIGEYKTSFHEIIGTLEYMKHHVIANQREKNRPLADKVKPTTP